MPTMFKILKPENLVQLRALLNHPLVKEGVWFHADGNMFIEKKESEDRKIFHNFNPSGVNHPTNVGAGYRYHFTSASQVPETVDGLETLLLQSAQQEQTAAMDTPVKQGGFVFSVDAPAATGGGATDLPGIGMPGKTIGAVPDPAEAALAAAAASPDTSKKAKGAAAAAIAANLAEATGEAPKV